MAEKARTALGKNWRGTVNIERARFRLFGPSSLYNISLVDQQDRKWLEIPLLRIGLDDLARGRPVITTLDIPSGKIDLYSRPDSEDWPIQDDSQETGSEDKDNLDLRNITIGQMQMLIRRQDDPNRPVIKKDFSLDIKMQEGALAFIALLHSETYGKPFVVEATRQPASEELELTAGGKYDITRAESAFIISLFTDYDTLSASGVVDADLSAGHNPDGQMDVSKAAGSLELENWKIFHQNTPLLTNINTILKVRQTAIVSDSLSADIAEGALTGSFAVDFADYDNIQYDASLAGENIELAPLFDIIGTPEKLTRGRGIFDLTLQGSTRSYESLAGKGSIKIDKADLQTLDAFKKIAGTAGVQSLDPAKMSDVIIDFEIKGPEIVLNRGRVANKMIAVDSRPGGTLNLETGKLDIHVVVGVFKLADDILRSMPVVNILTKAKDNLTQVLIQGNLRNPDSEITVKKEPVKEIAETTLNFLGDVINLQGDIIKGVTGGGKEDKAGESIKPASEIKPAEQK